MVTNDNHDSDESNNGNVALSEAARERKRWRNVTEIDCNQFKATNKRIT